MPYKPGTPRKVHLGECGHPTWRGKGLCRPCHLEQKRKVYACSCGAPLSNGRAKQCRECWMKEHMAQDSRPKCQRCDETISWQSGKSEGRPDSSKRPDYCRPCFNAVRKENRIFVEYERMRAVKANGVIETHQQRAARHVGIQLRKILHPMPCAVCKYNRVPCDVHRLVPQRGYVMGNVVQVCPNCHREIHKKVIPPPAPTILDLPDSVKNARS